MEGILGNLDYEEEEMDPFVAMKAKKNPAAEPKAPDAEREAPAKEPVKFRLAYVHIEDNSVSVRKFVTIPVALPALTLRDIDSDDLKTRIDAIVQPVVKTVHGAAEGIGALGAALGDGAKDLGTDAKDLGAGAKDALDEGAKAVGGLLDGLFGGSKKDN